MGGEQTLMPDSNVPITAGTGTAIDTYQTAAGEHRQRVILSDSGGFNGRFTTYRIPGRAGTAGQPLAAIWNAAGSTVNVDVEFVGVDLYQTVVKAITVPPPIIRVCRLTAIPTAGTAGFKVAQGAGTSNASVTTHQDASADGTSGTALATSVTNANSASVGLTQEFAPRFVTAVGYEPADRVEMLTTGAVTLSAGQGLGVFLNYALATQNPVTDMWVVSMRWEEYTP